MVTPQEIVKLRQHLRRVALGEAFLLQGGDCAELFTYCSDGPIDAKIKLLLQMSLVLIWGANKPVVRIARMAGQYAKPRSSAMEKQPDGTSIPSFRGDILNGFDREEREPDPGRLVQAYFHSAATLNFVRAQLSSGIADLHNPMDWGLGHVRDQKLQAQYTKIVESITESLRFMRTIGADTAGQLETVELFTSHEGLVLEYEEALTRCLPRPKSDDNEGSARRASPDDGKAYYNTSAHFLWIGDRTRQLTHGHVEYFRGIENPIGIKVGPSMASDELVRLLDIVNPDKEVGKVTLITRYGEGKVEELLPGHIDAVRQSGHVVVWQCDPMHGYVSPSLTYTIHPPPANSSTSQQHTVNPHRHQNPPLLVHPGRSVVGAAHPPPPRLLPRRRPPRADGRRRHRVSGRQRGAGRRRLEG